MSPPEINKLKDGYEQHIEFSKATMYYNGYSWAKGNCNSITIKGRESVYWRLGFWRGGGRKPAMEYRQQNLLDVSTNAPIIRE